jgi:hypothetical protein
MLTIFQFGEIYRNFVHQFPEKDGEMKKRPLILKKKREWL